MKKLYSALFYVLISCGVSYSQSPVYKIAESYFRSDPFKKDFSSFLAHLLNDPTLTNKIIEKKTDTSLFYFQGTYTAYNPFFFKPSKVEIILSETALELDSLHTDTIYIYQLLAFNKDSKEGVQELKKEFDKIFKRYKGSFASNKYTESTDAGKSNGVIYNFFDALHAVSPFSLSWFGPDEDKEVCLVLTIRMDTYLNKAILPAPFYTLQ